MDEPSLTAVPAARPDAHPLAPASAGWPLLTGAILFCLILAVPAILGDPDTLWQIATGGWILDHRAVPHTDPYSYTAFGRPWHTHEWLSQTLMALADRAGGLRGVLALTALAAGTTLGLALYHLRQFIRAPWALAVAMLGILNCLGSLLARPHVLAWPFLELWCAGLVIARARGTSPSWWLLLAMVPWVNLHGSFMVGLLLPLPFLLEAAIEAGPRWRQAATSWAAFTAAAWCAALLNPDTYHALIFPFQLLGMTNLGWIGEWTQYDFSTLHPLEMTLMVLLGAGLLGRLTVPPLRLLMLLGLVHLALKHWRHDQLVGLIGPLLVAGAIGRLAPPEVGKPGPRVLPFAALTLAAAALLVRFVLPLAEEPGAKVLAALDAIPAGLRAQPVLNDYGFGAYLIVHGDRPFIDSRADMYGDEFLGRFRQISFLREEALAEALAEYHVAWTIFPPGSPVLLMMEHRPGWHRLMANDAVVVHVRDDIR